LVDKKYAERGTSGAAQARKEKDAMLEKLVDDLENIKSYGKDAPKGRSFGQKTAWLRVMSTAEKSAAVAVAAVLL
jgi:hypothetical protein